MNYEEILKKAVKKAVKNGFEGCEFGNSHIETTDDWVWIGNEEGETCSCHYWEIIFDHDFAKAFWGEKEKCKCSGFVIQYEGGCCCGAKESGWQYHLQQMVLCEKPLDYIKDFIDEKEKD